MCVYRINLSCLARSKIGLSVENKITPVCGFGDFVLFNIHQVEQRKEFESIAEVSVRFVVSKLISNQLEDPIEDIMLVSFYSVSTQVISQEMD